MKRRIINTTIALISITLPILVGISCSSATQKEKQTTSTETTKKVPSEMTLPTTWTDTIYDTCYTSHSSDGKSIVFIGCTEEDKLYNEENLTEDGIYFMDTRNSLFLFDNQDKSTVLLKTTSPDGNGLFSPQFDAKNEWIYYGKQDAVASTSLLRYNLKTQEEELLTYCDNYTYHSILPNGNILFQNVREEIIEYSPEYEDGDWFGFVFCDIEMTPAGVCVNKSQLYQLDNLSEDKNYAMGNIGFLAEEGLRKQWNDSLSQTDYFNEKGEFVGYTTNYIESYNGWRR